MRKPKHQSSRSSPPSVFPDLQIQDLRMVVAIDELRSVTRAAAQLLVSQPALSRRLRDLEERIGVTLFARTRRGMTPTEAGDRLTVRARHALGAIDAVREEIQQELVLGGRHGHAA